MSKALSTSEMTTCVHCGNIHPRICPSCYSALVIKTIMRLSKENEELRKERDERNRKMPPMSVHGNTPDREANLEKREENRFGKFA